LDNGKSRYQTTSIQTTAVTMVLTYRT